MLNGGEVAGLTDRTAVIATPTGARQIYRRVPIDQARVVLITEIGPQEPHRSPRNPAGTSALNNPSVAVSEPAHSTGNKT